MIDPVAIPTPSAVTVYPPASAADAVAWFSRRLSVETDCADVASALQRGQADFVLLDVRSEAAYASAHVPGALSLPHRQISAQRLAALGARLLVVYCAGPHCNGADQAALKIALLGYPVKIMIGGLLGYQDEGFALHKSSGSACGC